MTQIPDEVVEDPQEAIASAQCERDAWADIDARWELERAERAKGGAL